MHPWQPLHPPMDLLMPLTPLGAPDAPDAAYTSAGPWAPTLPASPTVHPGIPTPADGSQWPQIPPDIPYTPRSTNAPDTLLAPEHLHTLPAPNKPLTSLQSLMDPHAPWHPLHYLGVPQCTLMLPIPLLTLRAYTSCQSPMHPCQPLDTPWHPLHPC